MSKTLLVAAVLFTLTSATSVTVVAQDPPTPVTPAPAPAPAAPVPARGATASGVPSSLQRNVQLDIAITDTISGKPETKNVMLVLQIGRAGSVRTVGHVLVPLPVRDMASGDPARVPLGYEEHLVELNLDGMVGVVESDLVAATVTFVYSAPPNSSPGASAPTPRVNENVAVLLRSGKPLVVSRTADPVTNRTVTVELTATIREP